MPHDANDSFICISDKSRTIYFYFFRNLPETLLKIKINKASHSQMITLAVISIKIRDYPST